MRDVNQLLAEKQEALHKVDRELMTALQQVDDLLK